MLLESQNDSMEGVDNLIDEEISCLYGTRSLTTVLRKT
jgi:hypothetical protein